MFKSKNTPYNPTITIEKILSSYSIGTDTLIHVGAHLVQEARTYDSHKFKKVIWVEALPEVVLSAKAILEEYRNQEIIQGICWSEAELNIPFHVSKGLFSSSALSMKWHKILWPGSNSVETLVLRTTTLNHLASDEQDISLINIDVQGAELQVLKGGILSLQKCDYIFLEIAVKELYRDQPLFLEIDNFLKENGFALLEYEINPETGDGSSFYGNKSRLSCKPEDLELEPSYLQFQIDKGQLMASWFNYLKFRIVLGLRNILRGFTGRDKVPN